MTGQEWKAVLARYGQRVTVRSAQGGPGETVRAFLQPVAEEKVDQQVPSPLGVRREDRFLYLGPADVPLADGGRVEYAGRQYVVQSAHPVGAGREWHWWGILRPMDREERV